MLMEKMSKTKENRCKQKHHIIHEENLSWAVDHNKALQYLKWKFIITLALYAMHLLGSPTRFVGNIYIWTKG